MADTCEIFGVNTLLVKLKGGGYEGGWVRLRLDLSIAESLRMSALAHQVSEQEPDLLLRYFGDHVLVGWNLVKKSEPIPTNGAGMLELPRNLAEQLFDAFFDAVRVPVPLAPQSNGGSTSAVASLPMEALLPNRPS